MHEQNCKKRKVHVVCTVFPLITTCRKNTLYFHFLLNRPSEQFPEGACSGQGGGAGSDLVRGKFSLPPFTPLACLTRGGGACGGLVRGKFSLPPYTPLLLSRLLTVPNSSCITDPWGQLQNRNTGRSSYRWTNISWTLYSLNKKTSLFI